MKLTICWLYGSTMNIYGDRGNVLALAQRCRWRGIEAEVVTLGVGEPLEAGRYDLFFWGGGQDREQVAVAADISGPKGEVLRAEVEAGVPLLAVCGGYQLLGRFYRPHDGPELPGIGLFDAWTIAGNERFIGNIVVDSDEFGEVVGFENHSGRTYLGPGARPLGRVRVGRGNNGEDGTEGCRYRNAIGCYLHGALLPKNPAIADFLIAAALRRRYGEVTLSPLDDTIEAAARAAAVQRAVGTR
ncbi:type 1 glutamine amidotransferase [Sphaerobacter thermophilus]|uniref:Lipid II isoglutaminyl synthase (glutamine-hydrolyzing) subunit GatD n=1 Tax=Sphaerobacter thermophilus (strain ATCC 49802 / DSM 20745 / KCCM 41009 / NCIMB 13125 / S 6022) TaxID=479434 RepID=D1C647_SPHTD|nr:glutamine amidotransferase [Sphaerobacter thermophilus]ACZ37585.1 CobB/CobQ domain protein glutamine amidotransferase [Sphaerobacter thermophilus DSM 20745]